MTCGILNHARCDGVKSAIDIGGGFGTQAILLARQGYSVIVVDPDRAMLDLAMRKASDQSEAIQARLSFVSGFGERAHAIVKARFDIVCCHSVLMYLKKPRRLVKELCSLTKSDGFVSVLSLNPNAVGMREGLQRRWGEALAALSADPLPSRYVESARHSLDDLVSEFGRNGFRLIDWYGVGILTDHLDNIEDAEFADALKVEWIAGTREPYRSVARCFHALFERDKRLRGDGMMSMRGAKAADKSKERP
ncbi:MAG: methyltransferase domain-containing protein [Beijerinckiaceae bacterium]